MHEEVRAVLRHDRDPVAGPDAQARPASRVLSRAPRATPRSCTWRRGRQSGRASPDARWPATRSRGSSSASIRALRNRTYRCRKAFCKTDSEQEIRRCQETCQKHRERGPGAAARSHEACRVLAYAGLAADVLGHVSVRVGARRAARPLPRPARERPALHHRRGRAPRSGSDGPGDLPPGYAAPSELPIHAETLRARPEVNAVVHAHPPAVVAADLAGLALRPVFGAYNIPRCAMARDGIPVYPRGRADQARRPRRRDARRDGRRAGLRAARSWRHDDGRECRRGRGRRR